MTMLKSLAVHTAAAALMALLSIPFTAPVQAADAPAKVAAMAKPNTLTKQEKQAGWKLLFDGKSFAGWHTFKRKDVRPGWQIKDGTIACVDPHNAGDLCTDGKYSWFELRLEYNISHGGNSGIMYHVTNKGAPSGPPDRNSNSKTTKRPPIRSAAAGSMPSINPPRIRPPARRSTRPNRPASGTRSG